MRRGRLGVAVLLVGVAFGSGCGGAMTPDELSRSVETLASTAAEGSMLAGGVADDRTRATFARVHARDLSDVVAHEMEKLNDAEADRAEISEPTQKAIDLADRIDTALGQIQVAPQDEAAARTARDQLDKLSQDAGKLAERL